MLHIDERPSSVVCRRSSSVFGMTSTRSAGSAALDAAVDSVVDASVSESIRRVPAIASRLSVGESASAIDVHASLHDAARRFVDVGGVCAASGDLADNGFRERAPLRSAAADFSDDDEFECIILELPVTFKMTDLNGATFDERSGHVVVSSSRGTAAGAASSSGSADERRADSRQPGAAFHVELTTAPLQRNDPLFVPFLPSRGSAARAHAIEWRPVSHSRRLREARPRSGDVDDGTRHRRVGTERASPLTARRSAEEARALFADDIPPLPAWTKATERNSLPRRETLYAAASKKLDEITSSRRRARSNTDVVVKKRRQ